MKMIDVLNMMAKGEIKEGTKLDVGDKVYEYIDLYTDDNCCSFVNQEGYSDTLIEDDEIITEKFLNLDVELIPPKPKKYLVKFNMRWIDEDTNYLNYDVEKKSMFLSGDEHYDAQFMTHFTKQELKSIKPVREFLEDMQGKYRLVEVEDNEIN